jgi:hypothetical protein
VRARRRAGESGQAAVEAALTLPLMLFAVLGTLQLFLMLQGRLLAEYAAFRATRVGSTHFGNCQPMMDAALLALLPSYSAFLNPTIPGSSAAQKLAQAWSMHKNDKYQVGVDWPSSVAAGGDIVWILRELPDPGAVASIAVPEDPGFDDPSDLATLQLLRTLQIQLVYWFPLKIPFANWVMMRMFLAQYGLMAYTAQNPLIETAKANWMPDRFPPSLFVFFVLDRYATNNEMVFPIVAASTLRMMTPARAVYWAAGPNCPPAPEPGP